MPVVRSPCGRYDAAVLGALGPGGAIETFLKAKEEGKVLYLGLSAHTTKGALEALDGFQFDTVTLPVNFTELFQIEFGQAPIPGSRRKP